MLSEHELDQVAERVYHRMRNHVTRATLNLSDDSGPLRLHQTEAYKGEVRDGVQQHGQFGISAMPLVGAQATLLYQGGTRSLGTVAAVEDNRYRPRGLKGGETTIYMVDGADRQGQGGATRLLVQGLLGWLTTLFGKQIRVGTDGDTDTVTVTGATSIKLVVAQGTVEVFAQELQVHGDLTVDGVTTVHDIDIRGTETGGGSA